jgi:GNAT superfamily N-acetyltransferase
VPPLNRDIDGLLKTRKHPFYLNADACFFMASRGGRPVGRIAAIHNRAHNLYHGDQTGFFGFYEAEDDLEVTRALVGAASGWLEERKLESIRGPLSPSTNYVSGLRVEGDDGPPAFMMAHNPPYYRSHLESCGFEKAMDLHAFDLNQDVLTASRWRRISSAVQKRTGCTLRALDLSRFKDEVAAMIAIYHDAWAKNWGFVPMNDQEIEHMAREMRPVIRKEFCAFVTRDGKDIGFYLGLPDYNRALIHMKGRLLPLGFLRLLQTRRNFDRIRLLLMGIRREHQGLGIDVMLYEHAFTTGIRLGVYSCEASWVLETNATMINAMVRGGARIYRTYRVFEKQL